jgi:putative ABC transport system permease protein
MLFNYLKVSFRNLWREKFNSLINIIGLSVGIACTILIVMYVTDELTFDSFHRNSDNLYRVKTIMTRGQEEVVEGMAPFVFAATARAEIPEIKAITVHTSYSDIIEHKGEVFRETMTIVSEDFFDMFDFKIVDGTVSRALKDPANIVITAATAIKFFGSTRATGELLRITIGGELKDYQVQAVVEDVPSNSSIQFTILMGDSNLKLLFEERQLTHWFMIAGEVYVLLRDGVTAADVEAKFPAMLKNAMGAEMFSRAEVRNELQPIKDIHLGENISGIAPVSDRKYTFILSVIAFLILLIACINFVTISLANSVGRSKEIGVRKSVGALQAQLVFQFLLEAVLTALIALGIGLMVVWVVLPLFNELAQKNLHFQLTPVDLLSYLGITMIVAFIAGFYPALVISQFNPTKILKGNINVGSGKQVLRSFMVGGQFVLTIFLISSTLIMRAQLAYLQEKNLGFDKEQLIEIPLNVEARDGMRRSIVKGFEKGRRFENLIKASTNVSGTMITSHTFGPGGWTRIGYPNETGEIDNFFFNTVSAEFVSVLGIKITQGRDFEVDNEADKLRSVLVNEAFVKEFNLKRPIGARIPNEEFDDHEIIGVVEDFNFASLHMPVEPLVLAINTNIGFSGARNVDLNSNPVPKVVVRVNPGVVQEFISQMEYSWNEAYPGEPFNYQFVDELLSKQYQQEQKLGRMVTSASVLAIIIGSLGLFALSMLTISARSKEMSIRKVLGASNRTIAYVLSKGYILLVMVALIVSVPLSYQAMNNWLDDFEFRITIGPTIFVGAGIISMVIALLAVSYHSIKLALSSPVNGLRSE